MPAASVEFKGLRETVRDMRNLGRILAKRPIIPRLTSNARNMIVQRTLTGKNANGQAFKPYGTDPIYMSRSHRPRPHGGRRFSNTGRKLKSVVYDGGYDEFANQTKGHNTVDLYASGNMFRAFQAKHLSHTKGVVSFSKPAQVKKALGNTNKKGEFVGLMDSEVDRLQIQMTKHIDKICTQLKL